MSRFPELAAILILAAAPVMAAGFDLGRPATEDEIAAWDIDVRPDGQGLPDGSGDVWTGEEIFTERCAVCHGDFGEAVGRWPALAGGFNSLTRDRPVKTIGSYWPYLSTVWDYVHRAMPFGNAQSLTDDEIYAITAYLLYLNDLVDEDFTLSRENFTDIELPNEPNFYPDDRQDVEFPAFTGDVCMTGCKDEVEITMRAAVLDVTPEETRARQLKEAVQAARDGKAPEIAQAGTGTDAASPEPDPALVEAGEKVFSKCRSCHQVGDGAKNRAGPVLTGVVGAPAGSVDGFRYSGALEAAADNGLVWNEDELAAFLENPRGYMEGTKMRFAGLKAEDDRAAVIAYLKSFAP